MSDQDRLIQFIETLKERRIVVSPSDERVIAVGDLSRPDGENGTIADSFRVAPDQARKLLESYGDQVTWIDLPVLRITTDAPGVEGVPLNVAPVAYYLWITGEGLFIDEMCEVAHSEDGKWHGIGTGLAFPFTRVDGQLPDFDEYCELDLDGGGVSQSAFEDWFKAAQDSRDENAREFGKVLEDTYLHMKDHDLEGSWVGEGPNPNAM